MKRRTFLQATGATTAFELSALAEGAAAADHERCRSFVRSLPAPGELSEESGYAFAYATDDRGLDDHLPTADAYGTVVAPDARVTVALEPGERPAGALVDPDREPDAHHAGRPVFVDRGRTRYRVVAPGPEATLLGVGPARPSTTAAVTALLDARRGAARTYHGESSTFRRLVERLGAGASLSATVQPDSPTHDVVAGGRRVAVRDDTASVRSVALFESASAAAGGDATATAAEAVPMPADGAVTVRRSGRAVVREATHSREELREVARAPGGGAGG